MILCYFLSPLFRPSPPLSLPSPFLFFLLPPFFPFSLPFSLLLLFPPLLPLPSSPFLPPSSLPFSFFLSSLSSLFLPPF
ncbi:hypothetical protein ACXWRS_11985, partial [Streptococcus pyogenes]